MFDFEERIGLWKQSLSASSLGDRPEVLDELEGHVRDEVERLVRGGEAPERAWAAAVERVGSREQLAREFAKVHEAPAWLAGRVALLAVAVVAVLTGWVVGSRLIAGRFGALLALHVFSITVAYAATVIVGALCAWTVVSRAAGRWGAARATAFRSAAWKLSAIGLVLTIVGVALGAWWARDHLGRYWGWDGKEVGGLCVLLWNGVICGALHRGRTRALNLR